MARRPLPPEPLTWMRRQGTVTGLRQADQYATPVQWIVDESGGLHTFEVGGHAQNRLLEPFPAGTHVVLEYRTTPSTGMWYVVGTVTQVSKEKAATEDHRGESVVVREVQEDWETVRRFDLILRALTPAAVRQIAKALERGGFGAHADEIREAVR